MSDLEYTRLSGGGVYHVHTTAPAGAGRLPLRDGQGDYQPVTVLMHWRTETGDAWEFLYAVITGQAGQFPTSQTVYPNDTRHPEYEPDWMPELVRATRPAQPAPARPAHRVRLARPAD